MKKKLLITIVTCGFVIIAALAQQSSNQDRTKKSEIINSEIISKLEQIVEIREDQHNAEKTMRSIGRDIDGLAEIKLINARIKLADAKGQTEKKVEELQNLVNAQKRRLDQFTQAHNAGQQVDFKAEKVRLLKSEVRLLREQLNPVF